MKLENYLKVITNLPVKEQCFMTKRSTWIKAEKEFDWFKDFNDGLFNSSLTLTISRSDIFNTNNIREKMIKTIYWGYPRGMRGNHFLNLLRQIDDIEKLIFDLQRSKNNSIEDFEKFRLAIRNIGGGGLSTYSKFLYFFKIKFNGCDSLILDNRLIEVFVSNCFSDFKNLKCTTYIKAPECYTQYLSLIKMLSNQFETSAENIELFLFIFGMNLKSIE